MKLHALPEKLKTARPKRLRYTVFTLAGKLSGHANELILRVGQQAEKLAGLIAARAKLATIRLRFSSA